MTPRRLLDEEEIARRARKIRKERTMDSLQGDEPGEKPIAGPFHLPTDRGAEYGIYRHARPVRLTWVGDGTYRDFPSIQAAANFVGCAYQSLLPYLRGVRPWPTKGKSKLVGTTGYYLRRDGGEDQPMAYGWKKLCDNPS